MERDEIYLIDLWRILRREWRWIAAVLVLVLAGAFAVALLARSQWEATAWIRPGQLGLVPTGEDPRPEPFQRSIDRMRTVPFQDAVLRELGIDFHTSDAHLFRKSFRLDPSPYAGLIELRVHGYSPQQAVRFAQATFDHLRSMHEAMMVEPRRLARARLQQAQAQLDHATAERDRLQQATAPDHADTANRQGLLIASMALTQSNQEVRGLQQAVGDQQARLSASYSYGTSLAWPIYVPEKPSSPNRLLIWAGGLLLGVSLGVLAAIARNARRRVSGR